MIFVTFFSRHVVFIVDLYRRVFSGLLKDVKKSKPVHFGFFCLSLTVLVRQCVLSLHKLGFVDFRDYQHWYLHHMCKILKSSRIYSERSLIQLAWDKTNEIRPKKKTNYSTFSYNLILFRFISCLSWIF